MYFFKGYELFYSVSMRLDIISDSQHYCFHFLLDSSCSWNQFACSEHKCISKQWTCDGEDDCGNGLDESKTICGEYCNYKK